MRTISGGAGLREIQSFELRDEALRGESQQDAGVFLTRRRHGRVCRLERCEAFVLWHVHGSRDATLLYVPSRPRIWFMNKRPPRCVVIAYDEHEQSLNVCTIDRAALAKQMEAALVVPWPLEDENYKLDDEFAKKLGGLIFGLLAAHQPDLNAYISVTHHPDAIQSPEPPTD
jgi:hypothetical protein